MNDFLKWLWSDAPDHVLFLVAMAGIVFFFGVLFAGIVALAAGLWFVTLLLWVGLPGWIVVHAYAEDRARRDR